MTKPTASDRWIQLNLFAEEDGMANIDIEYELPACPACNGSGAGEESDPGHPVLAFDDCDACNGTGKVPA